MKKGKLKATHQFVTNERGEKVSVILPIKEYLQLLESAEESEDIKLYDAVKSKKEKKISFDEYLKTRSKKSMPLYKIEITQTAAKQLDKLPLNISKDLIQVIQSLSAYPRPHGCKKLKGRKGYRVRKGKLQDYL